MSEPIGKNTADWLTLKHKADENEARWQAVREDLEEKLAIATEALTTIEQIDIDTHKRHPEYEGQWSEYADVARQSLSKIRGGE